VSLEPFPDLIELSDFSGNWDQYQEAVYNEFLSNILKKLTFMSKPVSCKYSQPINGMHRCFWHLITFSQAKPAPDEEREVDMRRCERVNWISHIVNNFNDPDVSCWEQKRGSRKNVVLWAEKKSYMIVLSKRKDSYMLTTAYTHGGDTARKNFKERENSFDPRT
jgi:hypothetical protein